MTYPVNSGSATVKATSRIRALTRNLDEIERSNRALRGELTKEKQRRAEAVVLNDRLARRLRGVLYELYGDWARVREEMR